METWKIIFFFKNFDLILQEIQALVCLVNYLIRKAYLRAQSRAARRRRVTSFSSIMSHVFTSNATVRDRANQLKDLESNLRNRLWFWSNLLIITIRLLAITRKSESFIQIWIIAFTFIHIFSAGFFSDEEYNDSKERREGRVTPSLEDYVSTLDTETPLISVKSSENMCTFGLNNCQINEICKQPNPRRRTGICICKKGYARDEQNICQPSLSDRETHESIFVEESQSVAHSANGNSINNITSLNTDSSEASATHPLVVSAGPNQVSNLIYYFSCL